MTPLTIPRLVHIYNTHQLLLAADGGRIGIVDIPAVEYMIRTDTYAPVMQAGDSIGQLYMSKSGSTVYADMGDRKYRFPYGYVVRAMFTDRGYALGHVCTVPEVTA